MNKENEQGNSQMQEYAEKEMLSEQYVFMCSHIRTHIHTLIHTIHSDLHTHTHTLLHTYMQMPDLPYMQMLILCTPINSRMSHSVEEGMHLERLHMNVRFFSR